MPQLQTDLKITEIYTRVFNFDYKVLYEINPEDSILGKIANFSNFIKIFFWMILVIGLFYAFIAPQGIAGSIRGSATYYKSIPSESL